VAPSDGVVADLLAAGCVPGSRGIVVAGAGCGDPASVHGLAEALAWPVLADPRSGLRRPDYHLVVSAADGILRAPAFVAAHRPEVVLVLGQRWASKIVNSFVAGSPRILVDPVGSWSDPERSADRLVRCDPTLLCTALAAAGRRHGTLRGAVAGGGPWVSDWLQAESGARRAIQFETATDTDSHSHSSSRLETDPPWTEPELARRLVAALPGGTDLVVSSSMPIRDVEAFGAPRADPPRVFANRGANGIDGVVSTALGVAMASGPTVVLVGDLAFLHDVSALVGPTDQDTPLTVVVADNGGGGIFSFLPPATSLDGTTFERLFGTPQSVDVGAVAGGFGWVVEEVDRTSDVDVLAGALGRARERGGRTVVRVRLPDRSANVAVHDRVNAAVVAAVDG
jgi:2-succinyl-5-enolpyruvyl-6-hydroxy-3-cyclohexene-1-carboxylate synthase